MIHRPIRPHHRRCFFATSEATGTETSAGASDDTESLEVPRGQRGPGGGQGGNDHLRLL